MVRFIKINSNRFLSTDSKFSLIKHRDYYQILMNSKIPSWNYKFSSIECAEKFLNDHDYLKATTTHMPMSSDDIEFILDMYGFSSVGHNKWVIENDNNDSYFLSIQPNESSIKISEKKKGKFLKDHRIFNDAMDAIDYLDLVNSSIQIKAYTSLDEFRIAITAAGRPSARDIMKNMVRVKSSNLWSYCIEIKDRHDSTGTLYIQFKGKNGGPGDVYQYIDFPITLWRRFITAPSKGHFFWQYIRNNYRYRKLTGNKRGVLPNAIN